MSEPATATAAATTATRCGVIAIVGAPNAGKSTLVNRLVGQKVAIVSAKAQTTRARLLGVAIEGTRENGAQLLLVDTPGIMAPRRRLDRAMVAAAWSGAAGADLLCLVVDGRTGVGPKVTAVAQALAARAEPRWLVLNKVDIAIKEKLLVHAERLHALAGFAETWFVSAETGDGVPELKAALAARMPAGPWHYPPDQVSDASERALAAEITREQIFRRLHAELPYASVVETEQYLDKPDGSVEIHQSVLVERPTQRAIVLGKGGQQIKAIGQAAREELAGLLDKRVSLYLHVKVKPGWDEDRGVYRDLGLDWVE